MVIYYKSMSIKDTDYDINCADEDISEMEEQEKVIVVRRRKEFKRRHECYDM